jgi:hypothetical protein
MTSPELLRPHYREGQRLDAADLVAEQDNRIAVRRAHDRDQHGWGVAGGLELTSDPAGITIAPGFAVDGYGRPVVVVEPRRLAWADLPTGSAAIDLFLRYGEVACDDRVEEVAHVDALPVRFTATVNPETLPDWPVRLGRLVRADGGDVPYLPEKTVLTHPAVMAERVVAQSGTDLTLDRGFAVRIPGPDGKPVRRLAVTARRAALTGRVVTRAVSLAEGRLLGFETPVPAPEVASPWRFYRAAIRREGVLTGQQLRVEVAASPDDEVPEWYRFAVGGCAEPVLSVDAGGTTTVDGPVVALGPVVLGPIGEDTDDARLADTALRTWVDSVDRASRAVDERFSGPLVDADSLTLVVRAANPPVTGTPAVFHYELRVGNPVGDTVTDLSIATTTTLAGTGTTEVPVKGSTLTRGQTRVFARTVAVPADGRVLVAATALGVLPGGRICYASSTLDWQRPPIIS